MSKNKITYTAKENHFRQEVLRGIVFARKLIDVENPVLAV